MPTGNRTFLLVLLGWLTVGGLLVSSPYLFPFQPASAPPDRMDANFDEWKPTELVTDEWKSTELVTKEAEFFTAAIGNKQKLIDYIRECKICEFRDDARELASTRNFIQLQSDAASRQRSEADASLVDREKNQYNAARGNIRTLRKYVADCQVCAFARDAVQEIKAAATQYEDSLFEFELCNNDYLKVDVAIAGRQDPISNMWTSQGWWQVDSGQCRVIGSFAKGKFYYYAENRRAAWKGNMSFCTAHAAFTTVLAGAGCLDGESTKNFVEVDVGNNSKYRMTLNAKPWTFTALAVSRLNNAWGWSGEGSKSLEEAQDTALDWCRRHSASGCQVVAWVRDDICLALASGPNGQGGTAIGWARTDNASEARNNATTTCGGYGGRSCVVTRESCSR